ncbi:peptidoglycan recognition protein family protein [Carboxylicivirga sp. RSCT41]|uniref:peptidoglycan recognition protein family protein n=1 Tax=Carboxylicivirga agarovorans TaxID=3417570 RepID=UPI003D33DA6D
MLLKKGSKGAEVKKLQQALNIDNDGIFGKDTEAAVKIFQQENNLVVDGIAGPNTLKLINELSASTDISEKVYTPYQDLRVHKYFLPKGEYKEGPTSKEYLFLHHTAGWHTPYKTIAGWANDERGPVATEFVLGGQSIKGNNKQYDGELVQCLPEGAFGWHLGKNGSRHMHTHSVGIEICNFGYLKNGKTYVNTKAASDQIVKLNTPFRGYQEWHKYSDKQIETLRMFILWIANRDSIDVRKGLVTEIKQQGPKAFEYNPNAFDGSIKGMWSHSNVRKDKFDVFPQDNLMDMLLSL